MNTYRAVLIFPEGSSEGRYEFDAPADFIEDAPARVMDSFLRTVEGLDLPGVPVDNEINSAHSYRDIGTATATGSIFLNTGGAVPFMAMISPTARAA